MGKKIKSTSLYKYDYLAKSIHAKDIEKKGYKYSYTEYDNNNNMILDIRYDSDGEIEEKYEWKYDSNNNLIDDKSYLTEDEIAEHKTYERDQSGKILKVYKHYNDGSKDVILYEYDEGGNLSEKTTIDSYDEIEAKEMFRYENKKLVSKELIEYDELISKETFKTDEEDNILKQTKWDDSDGQTSYINEYDRNKNLSKSKIYNAKDELIAQTEYKFNNKGKIVEIQEESSRGRNLTKIEYDKNDNPVCQIETNQVGEINNKAERKFNENNDVVETKVFVDLHGAGVNQNYVLTYEYEYFD